jgi:hypothetical protein
VGERLDGHEGLAEEVAERGGALGALDEDEFVVGAEQITYLEAGGLVEPGADEVTVEVEVAGADVLDVFVVAPFVPGRVPGGEVEGRDAVEELPDLGVDGFEVGGARRALLKRRVRREARVSRGGGDRRPGGGGWAAFGAGGRFRAGPATRGWRSGPRVLSGGWCLLCC